MQTAVDAPKIKQLEAAVAALPNQIPYGGKLEHFFISGIYMRKLTIAAGTVLVGKTHATEHLVVVASGRILVYGEECGTKELVAGQCFVSGPGSKRAGYALEDTVFINIHSNPTDEKDLDALEAINIVPEAIGYDKKEVLS